MKRPERGFRQKPKPTKAERARAAAKARDVGFDMSVAVGLEELESGRAPIVAPPDEALPEGHARLSVAQGLVDRCAAFGAKHGLTWEAVMVRAVGIGVRRLRAGGE